jgi:hypothetical protein
VGDPQRFPVGSQVRSPVDVEAVPFVDRATHPAENLASSNNKLISSVVTFAVPYFDRHAVAAGSIGVFSPEVQLSTECLQQVAKLTAKESSTLSGLLGHGGSPLSAP